MVYTWTLTHVCQSHTNHGHQNTIQKLPQAVVANCNALSKAELLQHTQLSAMSQLSLDLLSDTLLSIIPENKRSPEYLKSQRPETWPVHEILFTWQVVTNAESLCCITGQAKCNRAG